MKDLIQYNGLHKIKEGHFNRKAIIYIRQSTGVQVRQNLESQRLQYSLQENAKRMGFSEIEIIDDDLGISASGIKDRPGFTKIISKIALNEIGIVFSFEASRLSRNDKDWCQLLEVCRLFDTLIGDDNHIYDLNDADDQLLLGIKGTLSVRELATIVQRNQRAILQKAQRGELKKTLPPGYIYDNSGKIIKEPNKRIQDAIELIINKFKDLGSVRQVHNFMHDENIELPVNQIQEGHRKIIWNLPTKSHIKDILYNPTYAGAYAYGKRKMKKIYKNGKIIKRLTRYLDPEEWTVLIKDHHEKYLTWNEYEINIAHMQGNSLKFAPDINVGAIRKGQGLLTGILRCGRCGKKLMVRYWGRSGTRARYLCKGEYDAGGRYCIGFGGGGVDKYISEEILKIINPLTIQASIRAYEKIDETNKEKTKILENQLKEVEYEECRRFEQYNEVDPRNRLVAAGLESRWNEKLVELEMIKNELEKEGQNNKKLDDEVKEKLLNISKDFGSVWNKETHSVEIKKEIIRTIIEEVIVNQDGQRLKFIIHWKGGIHTAFEIDKPRSVFGMKNKMEDIEIIRKMSPRYKDEDIARVLNKIGSRTGKGNHWNKSRVKSARIQEKIFITDNKENIVDILSLSQAAKHCGVNYKSIMKLALKGILKYNQVVTYAPWEIKKKDLDSEPVRFYINQLKKTGRLKIRGDCPNTQMKIFA